MRKRLEKQGDKLVAVVEIRFDDEAGLGLYKHDKKSPWFFCGDEEGLVVAKTNGKDISDVVDGCVVWDRKATDLEVHYERAVPAEGVSLLPQFEAWVAKGNKASIDVEDG